MATDYNALAAQQYDPQYNANVAALKAALAQKLTAYKGQIGSMNQAYDNQVNTQNLNSKLEQNNYDNNNLARGLGRSSIYTSGIAGLQDKNNTAINNINTARTNALNNIAQEETDAQNETNNKLTTMAGDRQSQIAALARQLQQQDFDNNLKTQAAALQEKEFELQKQNADAQRAYYAHGSNGGGYSSGGSSGGNDVNQMAWMSMQNLYKQGGYPAVAGWIAQNNGQLKNYLGSSEYNKLISVVTQLQSQYNNARKEAIFDSKLRPY